MAAGVDGTLIPQERHLWGGGWKVDIKLSQLGCSM